MTSSEDRDSQLSQEDRGSPHGQQIDQEESQDKHNSQGTHMDQDEHYNKRYASVTTNQSTIERRRRVFVTTMLRNAEAIENMSMVAWSWVTRLKAMLNEENEWITIQMSAKNIQTCVKLIGEFGAISTKL